jgi:simple sugar transport system permease protein
LRIELIRRPERSGLWSLLSPVIAVALTVIVGGFIFAASGVDPLYGLYIYFVDPLTHGWSQAELLVKAIPIVIIAVGLALCYLSNTWNIGAEGQYITGAILGGWFALHYDTSGHWWVLPVMLLLGAIGGALYALIPALLKVLFGASEILTSLMLVYVAERGLDYLVRGPWRDPHGFNFPQTVDFEGAAQMPALFVGGRLHAGVLVTPVIVLLALIFLGMTLRGFEIKVVGMAPRAGRFAGFNDKRDIVLAFAISGALAGLAGIIEVAGPIDQLLPSISPGYGFAAIIVAFLGRLNPIGILIAGLVLALSYLGGEAAQISLQVPLDLTNVLQGVLLFYVLACDSLILYRIRLVRGQSKVAHVAP